VAVRQGSDNSPTVVRQQSVSSPTAVKSGRQRSAQAHAYHAAVPIPTTDLSRLHVVVPVRGAGLGKSRLGEALDAEERLTLVVGLLVHTLRVLEDWPANTRTHVVTSDPALRALARTGAQRTSAVVEAGASGLNRALIEGRSAALRQGATAVLYLPADLPLLTVAALEGLLEAADAAVAAGAGEPVVVLAPADARVGTNGMLVAPPETIEPHFGEVSLEAHIRAAAAAEASLQLVNDPALGFDLDTPDDLERLEVARLVELQRLGQEALDGLGHGDRRAEVA
jgi:2-phospho-L-lactate guanylyltransferase